MEDLVKKLRDKTEPTTWALRQEAADEIERLLGHSEGLAYMLSSQGLGRTPPPKANRKTPEPRSDALRGLKACRRGSRPGASGYDDDNTGAHGDRPAMEPARRQGVMPVRHGARAPWKRDDSQRIIARRAGRSSQKRAPAPRPGGGRLVPWPRTGPVLRHRSSANEAARVERCRYG